MHKLWAPWRVKYITQLKNDSPKRECVFCKIAAEKRDRKNYIVVRTQHAFSVLNIYPYNTGHLLIVPYRHVNDWVRLSHEERDDLFDLLGSMKLLLDKILRPGGYNIGMNLGRIAGAGFPGHIHIHLVPRWEGDVNFMPVIGNTKVISHSLKTVFHQLQDAYQKRH